MFDLGYFTRDKCQQPHLYAQLPAKTMASIGCLSLGLWLRTSEIELTMDTM